MTLKNVIGIAVAFYTIALLVVIMTSYLCIKKIDNKLYLWTELDSIERQILEARRYEKTYFLYHNKEDLLHVIDYITKIEKTIKSINLGHDYRKNRIYKKLGINKELTQLHYLIKEYKKLVEQLINKEKIDPNIAKKVREKGHEITELFSNIRKKITEKLDSEINLYSSIPIFIFLIAIIIVPVAAYLVAKWIIDPIEYLAVNIKKISEGKLKYIPPYKRYLLRHKEYEELIKNINEMLHTLNAKQKELLQATKMAAIGTAISGIAHEINNPLNNIFLTVEVIIDNFDDLDKEEILEMLQDIYHEGERAREIVLHLLEFARSKRDMSTEEIDLTALIKSAYRLLSNELNTKGIETKLDIPDTPIKILGNFNQLEQVLINIIVNASQAMQGGGKLSIKAYEQGEKAIIEIADTGPGIPKEIKDKIFEPFFTTKEKGTGLGLSVSYSIIKKHHGDIKVESEVGKGTIFKIILPIAKRYNNAAQ